MPLYLIYNVSIGMKEVVADTMTVWSAGLFVLYCVIYLNITCDVGTGE